MLANDFPTLDSAVRYFFVHIPKTGGTSLFNWLEQLYGPQNCCEHIETIVLPVPSPEAVRFLSNFQVIGGHVPIDWWCYFADFGFTPITVIRNPIDQFYSHINHLLSRADDVAGDEFLSAIIAKLSVSTGHFLEHGNAEELALFENPQSKTIFGGIFGWRSHTVAERSSWLEDTYRAVMLTETMGRELAARHRGTPALRQPFPRNNVSIYNRSRLTRKQSLVLVELLQEDNALYRVVRDRSGDAGHPPKPFSGRRKRLP